MTESWTPTNEDLTKYRSGSLDPQQFDAVDAWMAQQPELDQVHLMAEENEAGSLQPLAHDLRGGLQEAFLPETGTRYAEGAILGSGGMGTVVLLRDRVLEREVAVKRLRPRRVDEPLESYLTRLRAFRREAAITARLEHPGIVPVHDVGLGRSGEPAFTMKRLEGEALSALVERRRMGAPVDVPAAIAIMLRVAEAIGYAHTRRVVHRDLKPDNIVVGSLGAVYVIDWGLAGVIGADTIGVAELSIRVGTPAWMAPEQFDRDAVDPRTDVFGLGGLLMAVLTGRGPRVEESTAIDLSPLDAHTLPVGLTAVVRRCLILDPAGRYADGSSVADELKRWLTAGLTLAQQPSALHRTLVYLRGSPGLSVGLIGLLIAIGTGWAWKVEHEDFHRREMRERIATLTRDVPLEDEEAVHTAQGELASILQDMPDLREARELDSRFSAALETHQRTRVQSALQQRLMTLTHTYRIVGPWAAQAGDLIAVVRQAGITLDRASIPQDLERIRHHALRTDLLAALVELEHALLTGAHDLAPDLIPELLQQAGPSPAWQATGRLLAHPVLRAHDLEFPASPDGEAALADPQTADLVLGIYGPEPRLVRYAIDRLADSPGDFWANVVCARAALMTDQPEDARRHALVALGAEPLSLWPHLVLAYVAMGEADQPRLEQEVAAGLHANPDHIEMRVLYAVALARSGHEDEAQRIVDAIDAAHLQYHLQHPTGHEMDRGVQALVAAGLTIPAADPALGPLVPHQH